ncbi:carbohydrate binding domain-containing protein, partial [candidate division KSB1 bacterium]|nr:carbohydrate binding domain-containing protein [candidate division KSB1 bacterium]
LRTAWDQGTRPAGSGEQVRDGDFENDPISRNWVLELHEGARATMAIDETNPHKGSRCAKIDVTNVTGTNWHIQWKQVNLTIKQDSLYTVTFAGRSDATRSVNVAIQQDTDPWTVFYSTTVQLGSDWKTYWFSFLASTTVERAIRLSYSLGGAAGSYWFDDIHIYPSAIYGLADDESLESRSVRRIDFSECVNYSDARVRDMSAFYISRETHYYDEMSRFLKNSLGVRVPIVGTNWNVGPVDLAQQSRLDYIDNHAYWDHPQFPSISWDSYDWLINNTAMVRDDDGGAIARLLAGVPFVGKPFTISEYNHPFPNRYQTEGVLFLTAYSAFHDADGYMFFDYPTSHDDWETDHIGGYFAQNRNTAMMALMPSCARAFRQGLIQPAQQTIVLNFSQEDILSLPKYDDRWWAGPRLYSEKLALLHAVRSESFASAVNFDPSTLPGEPSSPYRTDTGEIEWDTEGLLQVQTDQFIAAAGFLPQFRDKTIGALKLLDASDFATVTWVSLSDSSLRDAPRSLLTLSSRVQNTGMVWDGATTVHNRWGAAPTQMAPVRLSVELTIRADSIDVHPLDERGARTTIVRTIKPSAPNRFILQLDQSQDKTVWFGIKKHGIGAAVPSRGESPGRFALLPNYPNPFNANTTISYHIPADGHVRLAIFDVRGRLVETIVDARQKAGQHSIAVAADWPSGTFFCKLSMADRSTSGKMVLLR